MQANGLNKKQAPLLVKVKNMLCISLRPQIYCFFTKRYHPIGGV